MMGIRDGVSVMRKALNQEGYKKGGHGTIDDHQAKRHYEVAFSPPLWIARARTLLYGMHGASSGEIQEKHISMEIT
jgi:hypothetical protein